MHIYYNIDTYGQRKFVRGVCSGRNLLHSTILNTKGLQLNFKQTGLYICLLIGNVKNYER